MDLGRLRWQTPEGFGVYGLGGQISHSGGYISALLDLTRRGVSDVGWRSILRTVLQWAGNSDYRHSSYGPRFESHSNPPFGTMERSFAFFSDFPFSRSIFFAGIPRFLGDGQLTRAVWKL